MIQQVIKNIPKNPKDIYDYALSKSFHNWIDEKGTKENPDIWRRKPSSLSYEEAFKIVSENKPHYVISFRNSSYLSNNEKDYWEFGTCNIGSNNYGEVFIWICVDVDVAEEIFEKFKLIKSEKF